MVRALAKSPLALGDAIVHPANRLDLSEMFLLFATMESRVRD